MDLRGEVVASDRTSVEMKAIMNADDFGRSSSVNAAVMEAHRGGVLSSASLMPAGEAFDEAVSMARNAPNLAVGLHLVLVDGKAVLPAEAIPNLVDAEGRFRRSPISAGISYFFSPVLQRELQREISAQFERFAATGLPLSHVDGHLHMHVHPTVFGLILPLAVRYGACGIRIPRDDLWLSLRYDRQDFLLKVAWGLTFDVLSRWCLRRLDSLPLTSADRVYGLMQTGCMQEAYVMKVLQGLAVPSAELYFHPAISADYVRFGPNPTDLETLVSPRVKRVLRERGIRITSYPALRAE